ncbi:hypothetical protein ACPEEL_11040 [Pasteurella sp. PK-2025]|uniref:hypothetical protein n=1 Tax=unclassified Pasteurella TaxID=2621516 RepID=UPI003C7711F6
MPLPFILAGAAIAAAGFGVKKGFDAKSDLDDAERYSRWAKEEADEANENLEEQKSNTNASLEYYGVSKKQGMHNINLFGSFICYPNGERKNQQLTVGKKFAENYPKIIITREEEITILKKLNIIDAELSIAEAEQKIIAKRIEMEKMSNALKSIASGSLAGIAAGGGAYLGVGTFAAASTGTAISGLSGAAATNATLAWLGGGSLASGGFGIAGGTAVLGGLVAGPLLAIGGAVLASKAADKKDEAYEHLCRTRSEIEKLKIVISKLISIEEYTDECNSTFDYLNKKWEQNLLPALEKLAKRNITFKELSDEERQIVMDNYEINYLLYDFINEPTMNDTGDDVLPEEERNALTKSKSLQCFS